MGWVSVVMGRRASRTWAILAIVAAIAAATVLLIGVQAAFASHPEVSLPGSNFEIDTDANLKLDDAAPSQDWASVAQHQRQRVRGSQPEEFTGAEDDSFGQGTKEDTAVPTVVDGSIPPNKSDLLNFGVYLEVQRQRTLPAPVLAPRAGTERHDQHGLRVQPALRLRPLTA